MIYSYKISKQGRKKYMSIFKESILKNRLVVCLLAIFCCVLWGSAFPMIKVGYALMEIPSNEPFSQILFAGIRFTLAGILTVIIGSFISKKPLFPKKTSLFNILKLALSQTVLQYFFFYIGLANTTSVKSSIIKGTATFITILIACFLYKTEKFTTPKLWGCILGFTGIIIINLFGNTLQGGLNFFGEGFIFFSNITSAFSTCLIKKYSQNENPVVISGYQFFTGGLIMLLIGVIFGGRIHNPSAQGIAVMLYLAFLSAVAYSIWGLLLKHNNVSNVAVFSFMTPVCGVLLSGLAPGESDKIFDIKNLIALVFVCAGIFIVNVFSDKDKKQKITT